MASRSSKPGSTPARPLLLVGLNVWDLLFGNFEETPKTFRIKKSHYQMTCLKSKYAAVEVIDQESANALIDLIKAERAKDEIKRKEYLDQQHAWNIATPPPYRRPGREILAALGIQAVP